MPQGEELDLRAAEISPTTRLEREVENITGADNRPGATNRDRESRESQGPCSTLRAFAALPPPANKLVVGDNSSASRELL